MNEEPSKDWIEDCMKFYGEVLMGENAHWCPDWDFLPIDNTCEEIKCCTCYSLTEQKPNKQYEENSSS